MCGITGLMYNIKKNGLEIYESLLSIQHRGQDGAGICCVDNNKINNKIIKGKGLICNIFLYEELKSMEGIFFLGHTRYKTNNIKDSFQPFILNNSTLKIYFSHNGNIINVNLIEELLLNSFNIENKEFFSDSYLLFQLIFYFLINDMEDFVRHQNIVNLSNYLHKHIIGSFSIIMYIQGYGMVVMKDKYGIRPLVYGENKEGDILVSSESCSLNNVLDYQLIKEVDAGETIVFTNNFKIFNYKYKDSVLTPCLFEYIYFSRLDSIVNNISIYNCRYELGKLLGKLLIKENLQVDFIIPTPETSRIYAYGVSEVMNIPIQECIIKNRYINRTFIIENKNKIEENIKRKFAVIKEIINGKSALLLDDSVVRGNTSRSIIKLLRDNGIKNIFFGSAAPKIFNANKFGIYIEKKKELVTYNNKSDESIANSINADKIYFNNLDNVIQIINKFNSNINNMEVSMFIDN